jgi:hypothetical protein
MLIAQLTDMHITAPGRLFGGRGPPHYVLEPPGFQLHLWHEQTGVISRTLPVGAFDGPYRFGAD